ncbi:glycoside hydrolase family 3 N-terminal domain-containing protein [Mycobacterium sp. G7A2]|uniref:glycoside hydrolase family 3 N-terminal domain-containing protein n=1 Tax=Mycobacterium sp. G7A2 TaxID=3317307 RepID=UPI0035A8E2E5
MVTRTTVPRALTGVLAAASLLVGCASPAQEPVAGPRSTVTMAAGPVPPAVVPPPAAPAPPACGDPNAVVASMSTRDKLAQLLMVGVTGAADARAVADSHHVGGIMVGSWTDLSMLSDGSLSDIAAGAGPLPLAVSVDEEGGRVSRLSSLIGSQPSPRVLARTSSPEEVRQIAADRGRQMRAMGITIDFAPVVDVTDAADNSVIGDRSFGSDPTVVTDFAGAYAQGLRDAGILPVLKHFPGHGQASGDSHAEGVVTPPLEQLLDQDLVPYRTLTSAAPVGVMVGHMQVPGLTGSEPASLSPAAYALLRSGDYGGPPFAGPVFTDDLSSMRAISDRFGVPDAVLRGLQAGADVALWVTTAEVPAVLDRLEAAVAAGELTLPNVDASVRRVVAMKGPSPRCGG